VTLVYLGTTALAAFGFGFLIGELRAVREANSILDANMKELFRAISDTPEKPPDSEDVEVRPSLH